MAASGMYYSHFGNGVRNGEISIRKLGFINDCYEVNAIGFGLRYQKPAKSDSKIRFSIFLDINTKFQTKFMSIKQHSHMELCVKKLYLFINPILCGGGSAWTPPWRYQLPFCGGCTNQFQIS